MADISAYDTQLHSVIKERNLSETQWTQSYWCAYLLKDRSIVFELIPASRAHGYRMYIRPEEELVETNRISVSHFHLQGSKIDDRSGTEFPMTVALSASVLLARVFGCCSLPEAAAGR